jgi:hypothetical protein
MPDRFRVDEAYGNVYVWDDDAQAYLFYMKLALFTELSEGGESVEDRRERLCSGYRDD